MRLDRVICKSLFFSNSKAELKFFQGQQMLVFPLIVMGTLLMIGGFASLFLPETKGENLPQTIEDGEAVPLSLLSCCCESLSTEELNLTKPTINKNFVKRNDKDGGYVVCNICRNVIKTKA